MCETIITCTISQMLHAVVAIVMIILSLDADCEHACVSSESCWIFTREKNPDYKMWKEQILCGIAEEDPLIWINWIFL